MPTPAPVGRLRFDLDSRVLYDGGEIVPLAPLSAQILEMLLRSDGSVVTSASMREVLWGDAPIEDRNLNQQVYVLRRALRRDPRITIENVPQRGYRLVVAAPASKRQNWLGLGAATACAIGAILALLSGVFGQQSAAAAFNRDLAVANTLAMSEGADHLDRAATYYSDVIALDSRSGAGYGGLAMINTRRALGETGKSRAHAFSLAICEANKALQRNSKESSALTALGIVESVYERNPKAAARMFDGAVAADPTGESPRGWRAKFRLSIGDFEGAGADFRAMSQVAPTSGWALGLLGEWLILNHCYVQASAVLAQAVDLGNHPGFTRYWLARAYTLRGLDSQALRLSNQLLALYPNEPGAVVLRLRIEARRGEIRAALADLAGLERPPSPWQVDPLALASAYVALGKQAEAERTLRHYLSTGTPGIDEIARIRIDPDFASFRNDPSFRAVAVTM
jgi:DNA-binding winged helix-turn-helix (wHTH) protein/Tfp pilus assembly protein PilF